MRPGIQAQRGMVLVVGLLMLLVITILGVSALSNATLEQRMAANSQNAGITFQTAESAITRSLADGDLLDKAMMTLSPIDTSYSEFGAALTVSSRVSTSGTQVLPVGSSIGNVGAYAFDVTGAARMPSTGADSEHLQRIRKLAPAAN